MPTLITRRPAFALQTLALATLTALLVACGPGVGGTGTGASSALDTFGASAASVCTGELAALLSCPPASSTAAPAPVSGAPPVVLADRTPNPRVELVLLGNQAELLAPCAGLRFRGDWGLLAGQAARYYGTSDRGTTGTDASAAPASLSVQLLGAEVQVTVRDFAGQVLLGPVLLGVVPGAAPPGSC
jgi:hypothetical protein